LEHDSAIDHLHGYTKCSRNLDGTLIILQSPISEIILNADSTAGRRNMPALRDMKNNHEHRIQMLLLHAASSYPLFTRSESNIELHNHAGDFASGYLDIPCWTQAQHGTSSPIGFLLSTRSAMPLLQLFHYI